jgi:hypothetical protein
MGVGKQGSNQGLDVEWGCKTELFNGKLSR